MTLACYYITINTLMSQNYIINIESLCCPYSPTTTHQVKTQNEKPTAPQLRIHSTIFFTYSYQLTIHIQHDTPIISVVYFHVFIYVSRSVMSSCHVISSCQYVMTICLCHCVMSCISSHTKYDIIWIIYM